MTPMQYSTPKYPQMQNLTLITRKHQTQMSDSIVTKGGRFIDFKNVNVMKTKKKKKKESIEMFQMKES